MALRHPPDPHCMEIVPVVRYAVSRRLAGRPDYWDYATLLELEVLADEEERTSSALSNALAAVVEAWDPETAANNINLIIQVRQRRNELQPWVKEVESALLERVHVSVSRTGT